MSLLSRLTAKRTANKTMSNIKSEITSASLDDLLEVNRDRFDRIFSKQMSDAGLEVGGSIGQKEPISSKANIIGSKSKKGASDRLIERFGGGWSSEIIEHKVENGVVTVLCKLTIDGVSKMQFGTARTNGNAGRAMQAAVEDARRRY